VPTLPKSGPTPSEQQRGSAAARGYDWRWQQAAKRFKQQYPLCGMRPNGQKPVMSECHDKGLLVPGYQVDHVVPHRGNRALFDDSENNWQVLCRSCGAAKSAVGL
jgi:5-methylcytosine-specific restriction protein A